jgi:hypothetical protein
VVKDSGRCAICSIENKETEPRVYCPKCEAPHCESCWYYNDRRCAIYGCARTSMIPPVVHPPGVESPVFRPDYRGDRARPGTDIAIMSIVLLIISCMMMLGLISSWNVRGDDFFYEEPNSSDDSGFSSGNRPESFQFRSVKIRFNDGSSGTISGNIRYNIPNRHNPRDLYQ